MLLLKGNIWLASKPKLKIQLIEKLCKPKPLFTGSFFHSFSL